MKITIEKVFDKAAKTYHKTEEVRFKQYTIKTLESTKKFLNVNDNVLDFGCATGTKALELAGYVKKIVAIDISSKMIEVAKSKSVECNIKNVDFMHATLFDESLYRESFDVILTFNVLHLLDDSSKTIQRINELLKPGGLFISATPCLNEKMSFSMKLQFSFFILLMKSGLFPSVIRFKFSELDDLITVKNFKIIETEKSYDRLSGYFIVAKKI